MRHNLNERMNAIRIANRSILMTPTERRVFVALLSRAPLELEQGRASRTTDLVQDAFGEDSKSNRNQTLRALRELESMGLVCRHYLGSKKDHNQAATTFINWPGCPHECSRSSTKYVDESSNDLMPIIHQFDGPTSTYSVPNSVQSALA